MSEDSWLIGFTFVVWMALALVYGLVPAFAMPGATLLWGVGAMVFLVIAILIVAAERRTP